jgi:hypothetical protein
MNGGEWDWWDVWDRFVVGFIVGATSVYCMATLLGWWA